MATILHLSDLHFGKELAAPVKDKLQGKDGAKELAEKLYKHFFTHRRDEIPNIDAIIITGDVSDAGRAGQYKYALPFCETLLDLFDLDNKSLMVVPGNHDINWEDTDLQSGAQYEAFANFYDKLMGIEWNPLEPTRLEFNITEPDIGTPHAKCVIFGLNSCSVENKIWRGLGYVHEEQFGKMKSWLQEKQEDNYILRLVAVHHHPVSVHNYQPSFLSSGGGVDLDEISKTERPFLSTMMNASKLFKVCSDSSVAAIFHGHSHAPFYCIHSKYHDPGPKLVKSIADSTVVIGSGSVSSGDGEFKESHWQIAQFEKAGQRGSCVHIWPFYSEDEYGVFGEVEQPGHLTIPVRNQTHAVEQKAMDSLSARLNKELIGEYTHETFDALLRITIEALENINGETMGCATIATLIPGVAAYRIEAIYKYEYSLRHLVYRIGEDSITTTCAKRKRAITVPIRSECAFASQKKNPLYLKAIGGNEQTCLAVPLGSDSEGPPYAVISFARARHKERDQFGDREATIVEDIADILENSLRMAELSRTSKTRKDLLYLYEWLHRVLDLSDVPDVTKKFSEIAQTIYSYFGLIRGQNECLAMFLPDPRNHQSAYCIAEVGFGSEKANKMVYRIGESEGLTGGIIESREYDFCIDHLSENKKSWRGKTTSGKCFSDRKPVTDHLLSFVGVPLGNGDKDHNRGALITNIATPIGFSEPEYIEAHHVYPMQIIATLLNPTIENVWKLYFESVVSD